MYELKKIGIVFTGKFVGTGPSAYKQKKKNYRAAVSQRLRNTALEHGTGCLIRRTLLCKPVGRLLSFVLQCFINYDF